ncbi:hypothetical protein OGY33_16245 [Citrobacter sp. Cpo032]|uniref:gp53-like domain-containing protein n=1 Tax=Citrobacter TaxID=544 RepID=UPI0025791A04|nr:hypothetical protein [Citrobacter sp. Cpo032]MDM2921039.1 hypothetical protein [Citrobacter sp. Cpo032]
MANLPETPQWEDGIYQIEVSDPVLGGPDGISNRQAKQLAKRTSYLKQQVESGDKNLADHIAAPDPHTQYAPKESPALTGTPTAPTLTKTDNSTKLATTGHVKNVVADYAPLASPALTGKPTAPTAVQASNDTQLATTAFVKAALAALVASSPEALDTLNELAAALGNDPNFATTMTNALAGKQPLDNTLTALSGKSVSALLEYLGFTKVGRDIIAGGTTSDVLAYLGVPDLLKGKQDADNTLTALARLAGAANKLPYFSGPDVMSMTDFSDIGRAIIAASTKSSVLSYLELGSAAKKNTGTDADQIPDMSSFAFGSRWITLPSGHIIQFDVLTAGVGDKANWPVTNYPIPFPNELLLPPVAIHTGNGAVDTSVNFIVDTEASLTRFRAGTNGLTPQNGAYIAIGR